MYRVYIQTICMYVFVSFFNAIKKYVKLCTHRGLFKVQDGGQRVPTAGPRGDKSRGSLDRHGGVGGHLLVHTQLLQRRKTLTKNRRCRTQSTTLRNKEVCNGRSHTLKNILSHFSILSSFMKCCKTNNQGECDESVLPLCRL